MGYHELPYYKGFWSTSPDLGVKFISEIMSPSIFEKNVQYLHCDDNYLPIIKINYSNYDQL